MSGDPAQRAVRMAAIRGALQGMVQDDDLEGLELAAKAFKVAVEGVRKDPEGATG